MTTKFHKRDSVEKMMFGYVFGLTKNLPSVSVRKAIEGFIKHFDIFKEYNSSSLETTYNRMLREYFEEQKSKKDGKEESRTEEKIDSNSKD